MTSTGARSKLSDYIYMIGSSKAASDYSVITDYLINHIRKTFTNGEDIVRALEERAEIDLMQEMPQLIQSASDNPAVIAQEEKQYAVLYQAEISDFVKRKSTYKANRSNAYGLLVAQCSKALVQKLETRTDWATSIKNNPINLLNAIEEHSLTYKENKYEASIVIDSLESFIKTKQRDDEDLVDFTRRFKSARDVMESHMGSPMVCVKMLESDPAFVKGTTSSHSICRDNAAAKIYSLLFLRNVDQLKYGSVLKGLEAQFSLGQDQYPKTLVGAIGVLSDHPFDQGYAEARRKKKEKERTKKDRNTSNKKEEEAGTPEEMTFAQLEGACYCCGKKGHKSPQCKKKDKIPKAEWAINKTSATAFNQQTVKNAETQATQAATPPPIQQTTTTGTSADKVKFDWMDVNAVHVVMNQSMSDMKEWILLDTGSTVNVFCNEKFVRNIRKATKTLEVHTNAGIFKAKKMADLPWHDIEVWYDPNSITNVLSFAIMAENFSIKYDNSKEDAFMINTPKGVLKFQQVSKYLYLFIPDGELQEKILLQTVDENKKFYTPQQVERAKRARDLSRAIGCPSDADLKAILKMNTIKDCPVIEADIKLAEAIFGKDMAILKGKTTRRKTTPVI